MPRRRIVVTGHDDEDAAARVGRLLRDAGHEVVFTGVGLTPEQLRHTVVAEDVRGVVWVGDHTPEGVDVPVLWADALSPDALVEAVDQLSDGRG